MTMAKQLKTALLLFLILSVLTGVIYPLVITGIAHVFFPWRANGSIITEQGKPVGSLLIGQSFTAPKYVWGRPSATTPAPYDAQNSTGSNLGPSNPALLAAVATRIALLHQADPSNTTLIPVDLVTASGSGLDPQISPAAAYYQAGRIAKARGLPKQEVIALMQSLVKPRTFGILGEPTINVLQLNLALDKVKTSKEAP